MTAQQVELLGILRDFGPLTRKAIVEIWLRRYIWIGGGLLRAIGKRLCTLERRGWAQNRLQWTIGWNWGYNVRDRKIWVITYDGFQALEAKKVKHEN